MPSTDMDYQGYKGSAEVSVEDECIHGRILFIEDVITYEGETFAELRTAFTEAVDRYLADCAAHGKSPNKACSGSFNVRVGPERHRAAAIAARQAGQSLNEFVSESVRCAIERQNTKPVEHVHRHIHKLDVGSERYQKQIVISSEAQWESANERPHHH